MMSPLSVSADVRNVYYKVAFIHWGFNLAIFTIGINSAILITKCNCITLNIYDSRVGRRRWYANIYTRQFTPVTKTRT